MEGRRDCPPVSTSFFIPWTKAGFRVKKHVLRRLVLVLMILFPTTAWATHETDHRFTVFGYVRDDKGEPIEDTKVMVVDTRVGEGSTAFTDRSGYYEVLLHLHNDNQGDEIKITALDQFTIITANFDPSDKRTERKVQVDFGAPPAEKSSSPATLWIYGAGVVLIMVALVYWRVHTQKKAKVQAQGWKKSKKKKGN